MRFTSPTRVAGRKRTIRFSSGRPFIDNEIAAYPQVLVNGTRNDEADIKNRYPDGSAEFAIVSVLVPSIPTSGTI